VSYCDPDTSQCTAITLQTLPNPDALGLCADTDGAPFAEWCPGLNCRRRIPSSDVQPYLCHPPARMYEICSGAGGSAMCETGSICDSGVCLPRQLSTCANDVDCVSGLCSSGLCVDEGACYLDWATVLGG
jgi:hypothetical protein